MEIKNVKLFFEVDYQGKKDYCYLGDLESFGAEYKDGQKTWSFLVKVDDFRTWEVALGTGLFFELETMSRWNFGYQPATLNLKLEADDATILIDDVKSSIGIPWPIKNGDLIDMEFVSYDS